MSSRPSMQASHVLQHKILACVISNQAPDRSAQIAHGHGTAAQPWLVGRTLQGSARNSQRRATPGQHQSEEQQHLVLHAAVRRGVMRRRQGTQSRLPCSPAQDRGFSAACAVLDHAAGNRHPLAADWSAATRLPLLSTFTSRLVQACRWSAAVCGGQAGQPAAEPVQASAARAQLPRCAALRLHLSGCWPA